MKKPNFILITIFTIAFNLLANFSSAQSKEMDEMRKGSGFEWPKGKKMAISLTFDDARPSQPDYGIPLLDKYGVKATFYLSPDAMEQREESWRKAIDNGHEIGNHSLTHPCSGNFEWSKNNALEDFTLREIRKELDSANTIIQKMFGVRPVSFAFPCGQTFIGRGAHAKSYIPIVSSIFETGRGYMNESPNDPVICDLSQLTGMELDGKTFDEIKVIIESAKSKGQWLILAGHDMSENGIQASRLSTIKAICEYALNPSNGIWIENVHNIASYILEERRK